MSKGFRANELNQLFLDVLSESVVNHSDVSNKPLEIDFNKGFYPKKVRVYLYTITHPPGGRDGNDVEHKIQIILPNQSRGTRANFDYSDNRFVVLGGYEPDHKVFVLWDTICYKDIAYSRNVQVKGSTIIEAFSRGYSYQRRSLWGAKEIALAGKKDNLSELLKMRLKLSGISPESDKKLKKIIGI